MVRQTTDDTGDESEPRPDEVIKQFVDDVYGEFDHVRAVDYHPADRDTFVCMEWAPTPEGRTEITELQHRVTGVDKRFTHVDVEYTNVARGYVKFEASNMA